MASTWMPYIWSEDHKVETASRRVENLLLPAAPHCNAFLLFDLNVIYIYTSIRLPPLCQVLARSNSPGVSCSAWRTLQLEESFPQSCRCCTMKIMACNLVCHFNPLLHHSSAMGSIMINRINRHCIEWLHDVCVSTAVGRKLINIIGPIC